MRVRTAASACSREGFSTFTSRSLTIGVLLPSTIASIVMPLMREIRPGIRQASADARMCSKPLQVIALCHDTLKTPPHQFCIRFCIYAESICNIAYPRQKAKRQTVQMGSPTSQPNRIRGPDAIGSNFMQGKHNLPLLVTRIMLRQNALTGKTHAQTVFA